MAAPSPGSLFGVRGGGKGGGPGALFGVTTEREKDEKDGGGGSLLGNLWGDVEDTVSNIIPGTVAAVRDPVKTAKQVAEFERDLWGPQLSAFGHGGKAAFHYATGDWDAARKAHKKAKGEQDKFDESFHDHPLAPIADVLALFSLGGSRAAALGKVASDAGGKAVAKAALTGRTTGDLEILTGKAAHGGGEVALRTLPRNALRADRMKLVDAALKALPPETRMLGEFARTARAARRDALPVQLRHLADTRYVSYLRAFARLSKDQRVAVALIARVPLQADLDSWARQVALNGDDVSRSLAKQIERKGVLDAYTNLPPKVLRAVEAARGLADAREQILIHHESLTADTAAEAPFRHMREVRGQEVSGFGGDATIDALRAELDAAGRPHPFYLPDVAVTPKRTYLGGNAGTGLTPQRALADVRQSHLVLFRAGALMLHPDVLGPAFLRAAKHDFYTALHEKVKELAVAVPDGAGLPAGYEWVRETRGQSMPYLETTKKEHLDDVDDVFGGGQLAEAKSLTHRDDADPIAVDEDGRRLAVSGAFAREFAGEFQRAGEFTRLFNKYPMRVWRALVLNLRVPWLVNNILGNTFLYAIRNAGPAGLAAFVGMVGETRGAGKVRELLNAPETRNHLTAEDIAEIFPETQRGTFIGTNLPKFGKAGSAGRRAGEGLTPIDRASESGLRRAATEAALRRDPKVREIYKAMPKQTRSMRAAMKEAAGDENLRRLIVREVNDTLGDYLRMSSLERGAIRNTVPFYAWFREITRIAGKLVIDDPVAADFLSKVGAVGAEQEPEGLRHYLRGNVFVGDPEGGVQTMLALRGMNPLISATDVASGRNPIGVVNPFAAAVAKYVASGNFDDPANLYRIPYETLKQVVTALPETRVGTNPASDLYPTRTRKDLAEQFFGDPRRKVSVREARN